MIRTQGPSKTKESSTRLVTDGSQDQAPVGAIALYKKGPGLESKNHGPLSYEASAPGSDAYVASAQTGDGTLNPVANKASAQTGDQSQDP
ncbi:hypothetical protein DPMN_148660 [Dreissena polymorpha]|uniref:Uncharacterized protein n=1 Tax=Dreissena polymorpha TaxID=45954 RepID=A0A9D4FAA1_DREPO|nr:hypothetical protein DPMN_148660 [Dreissena polymorpha]